MAVTSHYFSHFAAVSLRGVAGFTDTFPSFPASGTFLLNVPGFQVPPGSIFQPQLWYFSRALPSIFISTTARMFSVSPLLLITTAIGSTLASSNISSFLRCSNRLTPIAHRTILIALLHTTKMTKSMLPWLHRMHKYTYVCSSA